MNIVTEHYFVLLYIYTVIRAIHDMSHDTEVHAVSKVVFLRLKAFARKFFSRTIE
jgi:hypothetical protein